MPDFLRTASLMSGKACIRILYVWVCACVSKTNEFVQKMRWPWAWCMSVPVYLHVSVFVFSVIISPSHQNHGSLFAEHINQGVCWLPHRTKTMHPLHGEIMHPIFGSLSILARCVLSVGCSIWKGQMYISLEMETNGHAVQRVMLHTCSADCQSCTIYHPQQPPQQRLWAQRTPLCPHPNPTYSALQRTVAGAWERTNPLTEADQTPFPDAISTNLESL